MQTIHEGEELLSYVEAMRSVKLKDTTKRMGLNRSKQFSKLSMWEKPDRIQTRLLKPRRHRGKISLRSHSIPYKIPQSLVQDGLVEYQPEISPVKRDRINQLREELDEKNPYGAPVEGTTNNFRVATRIIEKVFKKYEENLPLHQRPNSSFRHRTNVNKVLQKVLGPDESILPTRIQTPERQRGQDPIHDPATATPPTKSGEHVRGWKDIEFVNIFKRFKLKISEKIDREIKAEQNSLKERKNSVLDQATRLEALVLAQEGYATAATLHAHDARLVLGKKDEQVKALNKEVGDLHRAITKILFDLDDLQIIQRFFFQISPIAWRRRCDYLNPVRDGSEKLLVTLYSKESVWDGMTGDLDEEMKYLETMNERERRRKKYMHFEEPPQLLVALEDTETTNLGMIQDSLDIQTQVNQLRRRFHRELKEYNAEIAVLEESMQIISDKVDFKESHLNELKTVTKIYGMGTKYKQFELALMLQKIKVLVTQTFVEIFGRENSNHTVVVQLADIESQYVALLEEIDFMPQKYVKDLKSKLISDEKRFLKVEAENSRKIAEFEKLAERLKRSLDPPPSAEERCRRLVMARSAPTQAMRRKRLAATRCKSVTNSPAIKGHRSDSGDLESLLKMT